jgi:hypothetical protein
MDNEQAIERLKLRTMHEPKDEVALHCIAVLQQLSTKHSTDSTSVSDVPQTNGDHIRSMTDEQLAEYLVDFSVKPRCVYCSIRGSDGRMCFRDGKEQCTHYVSAWLQQTAE